MQKHFFGNKIRFVMATSVFFGNHHGFAKHKSACAKCYPNRHLLSSIQYPKSVSALYKIAKNTCVHLE